jgi:hypothetical protein
MTGPMPTLDGDIVVTHNEYTHSLYVIWRVSSDGEQACGEWKASTLATAREEALQIAASMAADHVIYSFDPGSDEWAKLAAPATSH